MKTQNCHKISSSEKLNFWFSDHSFNLVKIQNWHFRSSEIWSCFPETVNNGGAENFDLQNLRVPEMDVSGKFFRLRKGHFKLLLGFGRNFGWKLNWKPKNLLTYVTDCSSVEQFRFRFRFQYALSFGFGFVVGSDWTKISESRFRFKLSFRSITTQHSLHFRNFHTQPQKSLKNKRKEQKKFETL